MCTNRLRVVSSWVTGCNSLAYSCGFETELGLRFHFTDRQFLIVIGKNYAVAIFPLKAFTTNR